MTLALVGAAGIGTVVGWLAFGSVRHAKRRGRSVLAVALLVLALYEELLLLFGAAPAALLLFAIPAGVHAHQRFRGALERRAAATIPE